MELAPGLHRIGNDIVAFHVVVAPDGITLIDAGLPGHWREFVAELATIGKTPADVRGVVLTHGDSDHIGIAERLRREYDVPVYVHEADAARAKGAKPPPTGPDAKKLAPILGFAWYALRRGGARIRHLTEVVTVRDGETLELPGSPRVIGMPGHSPGSIAVQVPAVGALFVGDALTTRNVLTGATGAQSAPFTDNPREALSSLAHLEGIEAGWVLPGHGAPWTRGVADLLAEVRSAALRSAE